MIDDVELFKMFLQSKPQLVTELPDVGECDDFQEFYIKNTDGTYSKYIVIEGSFVLSTDLT